MILVKKNNCEYACIGIQIGGLEVNDLIFRITNYAKIKPLFDPQSKTADWDMSRIYGYQPDDTPIYKESYRMRFDADTHGVPLVLLVNFRSNGAMKSRDRVTILFTKNAKISMRSPCLIIDLRALLG